MTQLRQTPQDADAFLEWAAEQTTGRFELSRGQVVGMAPERLAHTRVKYDAMIALRRAIAEGGLGCEAIGDGISVRIDDGTVYEPDALVRCGPKAPGDALAVDDPILVVEVVLPSSRGVDTGVKLANYFRVPTVVHYLIVQTETRAVIHHRRDEAGDIATRIVHEGAVSFQPPGFQLDIDELFVSL
jgi:Uma2 family endonuclease